MFNENQPNILLIMADQWRGDCLSIDSHPAVTTPNIDEIAGGGIRFSRAYTTCPSCIPARRALLTGKHPSSNGMVGFEDGYPIKEPTLPQTLKANGYRTALVGRNMHQFPHDEPYGYEKQILGSTYIDDDDYAKDLDKAVPDAGGIKGIGISFNGWHCKPWPYSEHLHPSNWTVQKAREIINDSHSDDKALFLTTSFYAPHPPFIVPTFYLDRSLHTDTPKPSIGNWAKKPSKNCFGAGVEAPRTALQGEALKQAQAGYYGLINHLDSILYWLIADFKQRSIQSGRPWIIIFTSDHGEMLGDHYYFRKCEPYEGSARIPLLIQTSDDFDVKSGLVCKQPACLEDIMPTILDLAGIDKPSGIDGKSLVSVMKGSDNTIRKIIHSEHSDCYSREQAFHLLTDGKVKYIWRPFDGSEQLFNLENDPSELYDLSQEAKMSSVLDSWCNELIDILKDRPEGFVSAGKLVSGCEYPAVLPFLCR